MTIVGLRTAYRMAKTLRLTETWLNLCGSQLCSLFKIALFCKNFENHKMSIQIGNLENKINSCLNKINSKHTFLLDFISVSKNMHISTARPKYECKFLITINSLGQSDECLYQETSVRLFKFPNLFPVTTVVVTRPKRTLPDLSM